MLKPEAATVMLHEPCLENDAALRLLRHRRSQPMATEREADTGTASALRLKGPRQAILVDGPIEFGYIVNMIVKVRRPAGAYSSSADSEDAAD